MKFRRIKNHRSLTAAILLAPAFLCLYFLDFRNTPCLPFEIFRLARHTSGSNCCFLTCIRFLRRQVRKSGTPINGRIFQFAVIPIIKGFSIVNEAEVDVFLELPCFLHDPMTIWPIETILHPVYDFYYTFYWCIVDIQLYVSISIVSQWIDSLYSFKSYYRTSLLTQWLGICLPVQGSWVRFLVWEDSTCCRETKLMCHKLLKPAHSRAQALQQENWEASTLQLKSRPHSPQLERKPMHSQNKKAIAK